VEASGYLYTIAAVGMSFASLSVLTMILRQILGGQLTKFDSFVARSWIQLGFMITLGAILPPLFALFEVATPMVWRIASGLMVIILGCWALTFPRRPLATKLTRLPAQVITFLAAMGLIALALAVNAIAMPVERLPASMRRRSLRYLLAPRCCSSSRSCTGTTPNFEKGFR
jgi:branched-subunit amino acid transport protein